MRRLAIVGLLALQGCPKPAPPAPASVARPEAELVYFVLVDRFADGDPSNDGQIDRADPQAFHGGDIEGVTAHLDYLQALGVTTVWLSPVFLTRTEKIDQWGAFHGYWVCDLGQIEPRFGGEQALVQLSDELHRRSMRLVLDLVLNHTDYDAPLRTEHPDWFHPPQDITDWNDPDQLVNRQVHGLPDLAQEDPEVAKYLVDTSVGWLDRVHVDGYRIDAVRHMPLDFLAHLNATLDAYTHGFWTLGEDFQGGALALANTWRDGGFDAMFDFPLRYAMVDVFCKDASPGRIASTLSADRFYPDPDGLVTFVDNHDLPRIFTECQQDVGRVDRALLFLFATRGTPAITYGTEVLLPGGEEPDNRRDMPWEGVPSSPIGTLQGLRGIHPALLHGHTTTLRLDDGLLVLQRSTPQEIALIVVNSGETPALVDPPAELAQAGLLAQRISAGAQGDMGITNLSPAEPLGPITAPPHTVQVLLIKPRGPDFVVAPAPSVSTGVTASQAPVGTGDALLVVGADPAVGGWDPAKGLVMMPILNGWASPAIDLPAGTVLAWKLVIRHPDGSVTWEDRTDRYLLVQPGREPAAATWGQ